MNTRNLSAIIDETLSDRKIQYFDINTSKQVLLEELSIYFRELEFQNDELRNTQFNLEKTRDYLSDLIQSAPVGYVQYDENFKIQLCNKYFSNILEIQSENMLGTDLRSYIQPNSQDDFYFHFEKLRKSSSNEPLNIVLHAKSKLLTFRIESISKVIDEKVVYLTAFTDITLLKEIQNEILIGKTELENILNCSPIHIWKYDGKSFLFANKSMCNFFSKGVDLHIDFKLIKSKIHPDDLEVFDSAWENVFADIASFDFEVRVKDYFNQYRHIWFNMQPAFDNEYRFLYYLGYNIDVTDRVKSEIARKESDERYRLIAENTSDAILEIDDKFFVTYCSPVFFNQVKKYHTYKDKHYYLHSIHPVDRETVETVLRYSISQHKERIIYSYKYFNSNTDYAWKEDHVKFFYDADGNYTHAYVVSRDISERKSNENKLLEYQRDLKSYAGHLHTLREEERANLAREIHDDLGQILVALKIEVGVLKNELSKSAEFSKMQKSLEAFSKISTMVDNTLKTTRGIISGLRPDVIEILGFVDTVKAYVKEFGIRNTIISNFTTNFEKLKLNQTVELSLFRIIQEALTNISKHAMATKVFVDLNTSENTITLSISDNGVGFELDKSQKVNHYGVLGMKERVYLIEGELKIETGPGKGTKINITLPKSKSIVDE